jgi:hypothetical protein
MTFLGIDLILWAWLLILLDISLTIGILLEKRGIKQ